MQKEISRQAPGFWETDFSEADAVAVSNDYSQLICSDSGVPYWVEYCPNEAGRNQICRFRVNQVEVVTPEGFSVQSRVHEYGGQAWCLIGELLIFVNAADQQLYQQNLTLQCSPVRVTNNSDSRYIEPVYDRIFNRLIVVEEIHRGGEVINRLVAVSLDDYELSVLCDQYDFYAYPVISQSGSLAFITWDHPEQPWTNTQLVGIEFGDQGQITDKRELLADSSREESLSQPLYHLNELYVVSDRCGWWNIYRYDRATDGLMPVASSTNDMISAPWQSGLRHYDVSGDFMASIELRHEGADLLINNQAVDVGFTFYKSLSISNGSIFAVAYADDKLPAVIKVSQKGRVEILAGGSVLLSQEDCSRPLPLTFSKGAEQSFGYLYGPKNKRYSLQKAEQSPLVIFLHGGPTAASYPIFNPRIQYWTQRGFSVLDLNYRGSSNYGREYRFSLKHVWGEVEVVDIKNAIKHLVEEYQINAEAVFIRGNSSGGYSALNALCQLDCFTAGASLYGVTDPLVLNQVTHKFESYYLEWLIGNPLTEQARFERLAPISNAASISCPVIFFQGEKDKVVLPEQTRGMASTLREHGLKVECHYYPDEAHGFRQSTNMIHALKHELEFYQRQLLF